MSRNLKLPKIPNGWEVKLRLLPVVEVDWVDASVSTGWRSLEDVNLLTLPLMSTVGRLLPPTKEALRVAPTVAPESEIGDVWLIPLTWVQKVRRLK